MTSSSKESMNICFFLFFDIKVIAIFYVNNNAVTFDAFVSLFNICAEYKRMILYLDLEIYSSLMQYYADILL